MSSNLHLVPVQVFSAFFYTEYEAKALFTSIIYTSGPMSEAWGDLEINFAGSRPDITQAMFLLLFSVLVWRLIPYQTLNSSVSPAHTKLS